MEEKLDTPPAIVSPDGEVAVGRFKRPFEVANMEIAPVAHLLSGLRGTPLGLIERGFRRMRLKEWHYTSVATPDVFLACAVVNAGYVGNGFAYVVDRHSGDIHEWNTLTPLGKGVRIAPNSVDGTTSIERSGWGKIRLDNHSTKGLRTLELEFEEKGSNPAMEARFEILDDGGTVEPVVVVEQLADARWLYTHKCYGLEASGQVQCGGLVASAEKGEALAGLDWNRGYRLTETYWNWAAAAGRSKSGQTLGFNLTAHRHWDDKRGVNQPTEADADAADCALWLDGKCVKIPRVDFHYSPESILEPWSITDKEGLVDLKFSPAGQRVDHTNLGLVISRFHQPYGVFSGRLKSRDGAEFEVADLYGVTEQHYARW
jgi:hypothetical protein